jgi:antitoxin ParD1/3/4
MNLNLGPQWEAFIAESVKSGRYLSASEVVREGLRLLQDRNALRGAQMEALRLQIRSGLDQLDRGDFLEVDEAGLKAELAAVKREGRRRRARKSGSAA